MGIDAAQWLRGRGPAPDPDGEGPRQQWHERARRREKCLEARAPNPEPRWRRANAERPQDQREQVTFEARGPIPGADVHRHHLGLWIHASAAGSCEQNENEGWP